MKLVKVTWHDAQSYDAWDGRDQEFEAPKCVTVGFLVEQTKKHIVVAGTRSRKDIACAMVIPMGMVKKVKRL